MTTQDIINYLNNKDTQIENLNKEIKRLRDVIKSQNNMIDPVDFSNWFNENCDGCITSDDIEAYFKNNKRC